MSRIHGMQNNQMQMQAELLARQQAALSYATGTSQTKGIQGLGGNLPAGSSVQASPSLYATEGAVPSARTQAAPSPTSGEDTLTLSPEALLAMNGQGPGTTQEADPTYPTYRAPANRARQAQGSATQEPSPQGAGGEPEDSTV